ncbi:MAG: histone deacetylase [Candidatus Omnitrophica bacterium]|nr:histone deacetylase [Candidatus Omnitrophota bacterium]
MVSKTALLYSERYLEHDTGRDHPERSERVKSIYEFLKQSDLFENLLILEPKPATFEDITLVHTRSYIDRVKRACEQGERFFDSPDTAISPKSYEVAFLAAGGVLTLVDAVMTEKARNGFALVRPPGHHAEREMALGFCLFNNVAIAAKYVQKKYRIERVLIVDWDLHHGNGTQHIFEDDPTVFYFSTHQYPFYPGTGSEHEIGRGKGKGRTLNVPLRAGSGDKEYQYAFQEILSPQALAFKPEFVLISCGFDAHEDDPLGQMNLKDESYGFFTDIVRKLAREGGQERIVSVLEGGYNLEAICRSAYVHLKHLMI